ncbi:MAG: hypothetical protein FE045_00910 [Thermoplasmata archaeon]|nr:MAG: hypothetical protein FE045_00910 [Thermoplasmata archaeon]
MKRYVAAGLLVAIIAVAAMAGAGIGIKNVFDGENVHGGANKWQARMHEMAEAKMKARRGIYRDLLNLDREEGTLSYEEGKFYVDGIEIYFGDAWWLNHTIRSDYDGDGEYETVWNELLGLVGSNVTVNGRLVNETLVASHINGMFLRIPFKTEFMVLNGVIEQVNGTFYIDGYKIILPRRMARSDYDGDGLLERMHVELQGLAGSVATIDGYAFNGKIRPLHINGIAI